MFEYTRGYSEAPILRMTDYTMVKRKRPKGKTMIYKTLRISELNCYYIGLLTCVTQQVEMESFNLLWFSPIRIAQS
jgi:hypothetical protein